MSVGAVLTLLLTALLPAAIPAAQAATTRHQVQSKAGALAPGQPTNLHAYAGDRSAIVTWAAPAGGGAVDHYQITAFQEAGNSPAVVETSPGTAAAALFKRNLKNGLAYSFVVRAVNSAGSVQSSARAGTTPRVPIHTGYQNLRATPDRSALNLQWSAPSPKSAPMSHYLVMVYTSSSQPPTQQHLVTAQDGILTTHATISNLTNGQSYLVEVRAIYASSVFGPAASATATPRPGPGTVAISPPQTVPFPPVPLTLFLQPDTIYPGDSTTVFGSGFSPNIGIGISVAVPLYGGGTKNVSIGAQTNNRGEFSVRVNLPANAAAGVITLVANGPHHQARATLQLEHIVPTLAVSPSPLTPGSILTVRGSGYRPGRTIDLSTVIRLTTGAQATLATKVTTDGHGQFAVGVGLPANTVIGGYTVQARGEQSGRLAQAQFRVGFHPALALQPQTLPPGASVTVEGQSFAPRAVIRVTLTITRNDGATISLTKDITSGTDGKFTTSLVLPTTTRPGQYAVTATAIVNGVQAKATLAVTVHASIALDHASVRPGQSVSVNGGGFTADSQVQLNVVFPLYGGGARRIAFPVAANGAGAFSTHLTVPANAAASTVAITVTGPHGHAATNLQIQPIRAGIVVSPASVRPGTSLSVQGGGYLAGVRVEISLPLTLNNQTHTTLTAAATTDQQGRFAVTLAVPGTAAVGAYTVTARSTASGRTPSARLNINVNPQITVVPSTARPGQAITVQGGGFSGGVAVTLSATVSLYGGGARTIATTVRTDGNGHFSGRLSVPSQAASGPLVITARGPNAQRTVQFAIERIAASITLGQAAILPGSTLQLRGEGYPAGDRIDIALAVTMTNGSKQTLTATATANASGTFASTLQVPATVIGGTYTVVARSASSGRAPTARLLVTRLAPTLVASPTMAVPGTRVTVNGFGFASGVTVTIALNGANLGSATAGADGKFSRQITIPTTIASGSYALTAISATGRKASLTLGVNRQISTHFYFASIYTGSGYHDYLALLNPTSIRANVQISYQPTTGTPHVKSISINPHSRITEDVNADLGVHISAATTISADVPVVAALRVFHGYDGAIVPGVSNPSTVWYFANGNTGHGYREFIAIQNPNNGPVQVAVRFLPTHHAAFTIYRNLGARARTTVKVNTFVPKDAVGVTVTSNGPVVANRTIFIKRGMTSKIGVTTPMHTWYFADGPQNTAARHWIGLINPSTQASYVTLHAYGPTGSELGTMKGWVKAHGRVGYLINKIAHRTDVAISITSSQAVVVEQTTYVGRMHNASTDTFGVSSPAKSWAFASVNTSSGVDSLSLFNPNLTALPITVQYMRVGGQTVNRTYIVGPLSHQRINVDSIVPGAELGIVATSNQPFVALNRATFNAGNGSATSAGVPNG